MSLDVYSVDDVAVYGLRFGLGASGDPRSDAPVVVGKPKLRLSLSEQANAMLSGIEGIAANLRESATFEDLEKKVGELGTKTADLAKLLRPTMR